MLVGQLATLCCLPIALALNHEANVARVVDHAPPALPRADSIASGAVLAPRKVTSHRARNHPRKRGLSVKPDVGFGGVDLPVRGVEPSLSKRAENGSIIALATGQSTFVIPVAFGTPPVAFPLQLDTGSADLLIATTLCGSECPESSSGNPYYSAKSHSASFSAVNDNRTTWSTPFGDGSVASGFIARERVGLSNLTVPDQVLGMINATNMTLSEQKISGIIGLGFPRLARLAKILLNEPEAVPTAAGLTAAVNGASSTAFGAASMSNVGDAVSATESAQTATSAVPSEAAVEARQLAKRAAYAPSLFESLVTTPHIPYPVFAIALVPPSVEKADPSATSSPSATATTSARYSLNVGSLTLGGVSNQYVSDNATSGRTINDIEWHDVVPFGPMNETLEQAVESILAAAATLPAGSTASMIESSVPVSTPTPTANGVPLTIDQLESEEYLYWAIKLDNVAVNGTAIGVNSSYASIGLPSVALLDVGTNGIYGPQQDVEKIFSHILNARQVAEGQWAVPCDTKATLAFSFGGRYVQLQPSDWMNAAVAGSSFCLAWPMATPQTGDGIDWQLGTPFLKNVYSVFSYGINGVQAPMVGFLPLEYTDPSANASSPTPTVIVPAQPAQTVGTTLPNNLLPDLAYPTPTYAFKAAQSGQIQNIGLANSSAYSVGPVPVVTLPSAVVTDGAAPPVPGWPGGSNDHTAESGAFATAVGVVPALAAFILQIFAPL